MGIFDSKKDAEGYGGYRSSASERDVNAQSRAGHQAARDRRNNRRAPVKQTPEQLAAIEAAAALAAQAEQDKINAPLDAITQGSDAALNQIQMGLTSATETLQPQISQSQQYSNQLQDLLMGKTQMNQLPGYNAMSDARREAVGDLGTGMAGTGKFFSGSTAEGAANIGGAMENQLMQQTIQNLMMGAQPGQQMQSNLAGFQMGAGTTGAQYPFTAGTNIANIMMGREQMAANQQMADDANKSNFFGDLLGAAGTVGGFLMGGPGGAVAGGAAGSAIGGG